MLQLERTFGLTKPMPAPSFLQVVFQALSELEGLEEEEVGGR